MSTLAGLLQMLHVFLDFPHFDQLEKQIAYRKANIVVAFYFIKPRLKVGRSRYLSPKIGAPLKAQKQQSLKYASIASTVHREVEKVTKNGKKFSKPNFTNNSDSSNRFSAPESLLPKLSNGHSLGWELAPLLG